MSTGRALAAVDELLALDGNRVGRRIATVRRMPQWTLPGSHVALAEQAISKVTETGRRNYLDDQMCVAS